MPYYLQHHFDPDLDIENLKPELQADGSVDHYELNYVQNVEAGDIIAEWVNPDKVPDDELDDRFLFSEKKFPAGRGTGIKNAKPNFLFAAVNGRVCYQDGTIVVRENLTIPSDVDFNTGNVNFIGNLTIIGGVRSGFEAKGRNVIIKDQVEGAHIVAMRDLDCRGGIKGAGSALLEAGGTIKLSFCENAELRASQDILIKGALMHSTVYAGSRLAVGGRLTDCTIHCHEYVYVGEQLGGGLNTNTVLALGYNPSLIAADETYTQRIDQLNGTIKILRNQLEKGGDNLEEVYEKLESAIAELAQVKLIKARLWDGIKASERLDECKVLVPGVVKPGVEISIGSAYLKVDDFLEDVYFYYENEEVKIGTSSKKIRK